MIEKGVSRAIKVLRKLANEGMAEGTRRSHGDAMARSKVWLDEQGATTHSRSDLNIVPV